MLEELSHSSPVPAPRALALIRLASEPAIMRARMPSLAITGRWFGARPPVTAIWIAIELKLAKPHSAKVTIARLRSVQRCRRRIAEVDEGDEFVEHDLGAEQAAGHARLAPRNPDQEHDRREHVADQPLEAEVGNADHVAEPAEQAVGERDQRDERQHHRADGDGQLDAGLRALGGGHDDVGRPLALLEGLGTSIVW